QCEAVEIHLATNFQTIVMDHPALPQPLRREVNEWVKREAKEEWKKGDTEEQFIYKSRKKAIGPFKQRFWDLPEDVRAKIGADLEQTFAFLFEQLRVKGTRGPTDRYVKPKLDSHAVPRGRSRRCAGCCRRPTRTPTPAREQTKTRSRKSRRASSCGAGSRPRAAAARAPRGRP